MLLDAFPILLGVLGTVEAIALVLLQYSSQMHIHTRTGWWARSNVIWVGLRLILVAIPALTAWLAFCVSRSLEHKR